MIKQLSVLEVKKDDRTYQFILYSNSPLGEIFDVLTEMRHEVLKHMNEASKPSEENKTIIEE